MEKPPVVHVSGPIVTVDGQLRPELVVEEWQAQNAPEFGLVRLRHAAARAEQISQAPPAGDRIGIEADGATFDGIVSTCSSEFSADADDVRIEARHVLWHWLGGPVNGRWQLSDGAPVWDADGAVVFNGDGGFESADIFAPDCRSTRVFDNSDSAQRWSVADILAYLLATYLPFAIHTPGLLELEGLAGWIYPERIDVTGRPLREALASVAEIAGVCIRHGESGDSKPSLVFYRPGIDGARRRVCLAGGQQASPGRDLLRGNVAFGAAEASANVNSPQYTNSKRNKTIVALGALKRYEVTLELQPGWDKSLETARYRDFVRSQAENWPKVTDVFRKWVLNETGRYCQSPFHLPAFDAKSIHAEDFFLKASRPVEPCLSADKCGTSRGIVVEMSLGGGPWRRYAGSVLADTRECAIRLTDDHLPGDYFQAVRKGQARVRFTGTILSDAYLKVELDGPPKWTKVLRIPSARWDAVCPGSVFFPDSPAGGIVRDDTAVLAAWARRALSASTQMKAELVVALVDPTLRVGDIVREIEGRRIPLASGGQRSACVEKVVHRFAEQWTTELHLNG